MYRLLLPRYCLEVEEGATTSSARSYLQLSMLGVPFPSMGRARRADFDRACREMRRVNWGKERIAITIVPVHVWL